MSEIGIDVLIIALLILANGVFAMSEMAVVTARKSRLQDWASRGNRRAKTALELANTPSHFLLAVQIGITLVVILAGALGGRTLADHVALYIAFFPVFKPYSQAIALGLVVLSITYFSLVIGQLVPKRLAARYPETVATVIAIPLRSLSKISSPMIRRLNISADAVGYLSGKQQAQDRMPRSQSITFTLPVWNCQPNVAVRMSRTFASNVALTAVSVS